MLERLTTTYEIDARGTYDFVSIEYLVRLMLLYPGRKYLVIYHAEMLTTKAMNCLDGCGYTELEGFGIPLELADKVMKSKDKAYGKMGIASYTNPMFWEDYLDARYYYDEE